jgi:outer membrane protein OmpA-like peptidoglycan-associated protein
LLIAAGVWISLRWVEQNRVDAYVEALRDQPGVVVTGTERRHGKWHVSGLRDPLAADPAALLARSNLDPAHVVSRWEPYQALNPAIVLKRLSASLNPPPGVVLWLEEGTIRARGNAPQHWIDKARAQVAALPAGSPAVDLATLKDIDEPTFVRLRDAIQGHVITFDSNAPLPASGQDAALDSVAGELRELIQVARSLGFSVQIMIVGHADAIGKETSNLTLSAARAEVVRSMLRTRGIAPGLLSVRSAGTFEPGQPSQVDQGQAIDRRVTFTVSTSD